MKFCHIKMGQLVYYDGLTFQLNGMSPYPEVIRQLKPNCIFEPYILLSLNFCSEKKTSIF